MNELAKDYGALAISAVSLLVILQSRFPHWFAWIKDINPRERVAWVALLLSLTISLRGGLPNIPVPDLPDIFVPTPPVPVVKEVKLRAAIVCETSATDDKFGAFVVKLRNNKTLSDYCKAKGHLLGVIDKDGKNESGQSSFKTSLEGVSLPVIVLWDRATGAFIKTVPLESNPTPERIQQTLDENDG